MADPPNSHASRVLAQRGTGLSRGGEETEAEAPPPQEAPKPTLQLVEPSIEGPDDPEEFDGYRVVRRMRSRQPPRLWLHPGWRQKGFSIQWYPVPVIIPDLDRETTTVPQVIELVAAGGRYRIEGHHLEDLMARLNDQHIADVWAYCPRRWPDSRPRKGEPIVIAIRYEEPEGQGARANPPPRTPLVIPVPQDGPGGGEAPPQELEMDR